MKDLELKMADRHRLRAALGWLELGNHAEARIELGQITKPLHPDVLEIDWAICAAAGDWESALRSAESLIKECPKRSSGWVHRAYALRRVKEGGLEKARSVLLLAYEEFPEESIISYNLSCYAAQLGRLDEAWEWLQTSMDMASDFETIKKMALADDDLKPLWEQIKKWRIGK